MTFQKSIRLAVLLLGMALVPAMTFSQATDNDLGIVRLRYVTIVVRDYDEALNWYTKVLGLEKIEEGTFGKDNRWIVVAPRGRKDIGIILEIAKAYSTGSKRPKKPEVRLNSPKDQIRNYEARVGKETRWVFEVEDCRKFYESASRRGVKFVEMPVDQPAWGVTEAMFEDLYGNVFVIQSPRPKERLPRSE